MSVSLKQITDFFSKQTKRIFYYFACKSGGNAIQFIMKIKKVSYKDAVEYLETKLYPDGMSIDRNGLPIPDANARKDASLA